MLRDEMIMLALQKPRYVYTRLHALLGRGGREVNVKRVYRLYVEETWQYAASGWCANRAAEPRLTGPSQEWAVDFIVNGLATGRTIRILRVVDAYTREYRGWSRTSLPG